jgi:hypothetical protein
MTDHPVAVISHQSPPLSFFIHPAEQVATEHICCLLDNRQSHGLLLCWVVSIETEAALQRTHIQRLLSTQTQVAECYLTC